MFRASMPCARVRALSGRECVSREAAPTDGAGTVVTRYARLSHLAATTGRDLYGSSATGCEFAGRLLSPGADREPPPEVPLLVGRPSRVREGLVWGSAVWACGKTLISSRGRPMSGASEPTDERVRGRAGRDADADGRRSPLTLLGLAEAHGAVTADLGATGAARLLTAAAVVLAACEPHPVMTKHAATSAPHNSTAAPGARRLRPRPCGRAAGEQLRGRGSLVSTISLSA